ncbi:preprotein translocase subunit SecB [Legionella quinlivanii]|uniref:Protein-export protein SecB n=1 Tax=Legionella quinlivanii TaxID=45073 RepID=A0A0W0Y0X5_9GAMM|nr:MULTISPECIES: protein-export chaperone SecB [Legionella]KTD50294.1 preprotein translocase subunit SecB [Legionella quinlivanii]MCE3045861.1 protein-export chaperone SecB [Legionella sp. 16cNR16C]MCW8449960.1 protein-export chaperone SecB [Legionella quinlivanii]RAP35413.1 preprotein translocase subunit SecB [Legionella quinlivanii]SEF44378.1 protein translocase subunit secB [Legionella quinlivanii DSM 21216]
MNEATTNPANEAQFMIQRVYMKDSSFETPNTPAVFQQQWEPELTLDLNTENTELEKNVYEVVLTVTATVKNKNTTAFLAEVKQAGIFTIQGAPKEQLGHLLGSFCPSILFPYAREAITSQVIRGSFPQLVLAPINFDALYMQQLEEQSKSKADETETTH